MITSARPTGEVLDSVSIDKSKPLPVDVVVAKYPRLRVVEKASRLAVKLAKESVFGEEVMRQCTVFGTRQLPGLPREELFQLKKAASTSSPNSGATLLNLSLCGKTVVSVNQASKSLP